MRRGGGWRGNKKKKTVPKVCLRVAQTQQLKRVCVPGNAKFSKVSINVYAAPKGQQRAGGCGTLASRDSQPGVAANTKTLKTEKGHGEA